MDSSGRMDACPCPSRDKILDNDMANIQKCTSFPGDTPATSMGKFRDLMEVGILPQK